MPVVVSPIAQPDLAHNKPELIQKELLAPTLITLMGRACGLSDRSVAGYKVVQIPGSPEVGLEFSLTASRAWGALNSQLEAYVRGREEGHTREFMLLSLTNRTSICAISDPDLRVLLQKEPSLPATWLKKSESGTRTNKAGQVAWSSTTDRTERGRKQTNEITHIPKVDEVCRWVTYTIVDGEVAWRYRLDFNPDGSLFDLACHKTDAKELDPQYREIIEEVETEAREEMKKQGTCGQFGSVHTFWRLKKDKLRARGIEWRSPAELNPNILYD